MRHKFIGALGRGIELQWMIDTIVFRERKTRIGAVDTARACIRKVTDTTVTARLQKVCEADKIALDVCVRIDKRISYPRLRCQIDHAIKLILSKALLYRMPISDICMNECPCMWCVSLLREMAR